MSELHANDSAALKVHRMKLAIMKMLQKKYNLKIPGQEGGYDDFDEEDLLLATGKSGPKPFPTTLAFDSTGKPLSKQPPKLPRSLLRET